MPFTGMALVNAWLLYSTCIWDVCGRPSELQTLLLRPDSNWIPTEINMDIPYCHIWPDKCGSSWCWSCRCLTNCAEKVRMNCFERNPRSYCTKYRHNTTTCIQCFAPYHKNWESWTFRKSYGEWVPNVYFEGTCYFCNCKQVRILKLFRQVFNKYYMKLRKNKCGIWWVNHTHSLRLIATPLYTGRNLLISPRLSLFSISCVCSEFRSPKGYLSISKELKFVY
jgi:hypothetical protein